MKQLITFFLVSSPLNVICLSKIMAKQLQVVLKHLEIWLVAEGFYGNEVTKMLRYRIDFLSLNMIRRVYL